MAGLPKVTYRFNAIPTKIPDGFFFLISRNDKLILTFKWRCKGPRRANFSKREGQSWTRIFFIFKNYYKAIVVKAMWL